MCLLYAIEKMFDVLIQKKCFNIIFRQAYLTIYTCTYFIFAE
jgi:hypothetical protein